MEKLAKVFSEGKYPIKQVIFCGLDSVTGPLLLSSMLKKSYGHVDIIHMLGSESQTDVGRLLLTSQPVVTTCWNIYRTLACMPAYLKLREWQEGDVRVYQLSAIGETTGLVDYTYGSKNQLVNASTVPRAIKYLTDYSHGTMREIARAAWFMSELGEFMRESVHTEARLVEALDVLLLGPLPFKSDFKWLQFLKLNVEEMNTLTSLVFKIGKDPFLLKDGHGAWNYKNVSKDRPERPWAEVAVLLDLACHQIALALSDNIVFTELAEFNLGCNSEAGIIRAYNRILYFHEFDQMSNV